MYKAIIVHHHQTIRMPMTLLRVPGHMQKAKVKSLSENLPRINSSGKLNLTCQGLGERDAGAPGVRKEGHAMQQNATNRLTVVSTYDAVYVHLRTQSAAAAPCNTCMQARLYQEYTSLKYS